jgi:DNA transformation protein and related proteins
LDPEFIRELFAQFRPVTVRRMFSGAAISTDGVTFGLIVRGAIYLKVDETSIPAFEQEGSQPFTYTRAKSARGAKPVAMSYWRLPERLYDDPDELATWAARAFAIAQQKKAVPRKKASASKQALRKPPARKLKSSAKKKIKRRRR